MNLQELKQSALERHIPIIMDDTLEMIEKILKENKPIQQYVSQNM